MRQAQARTALFSAWRLSFAAGSIAGLLFLAALTGAFGDPVPRPLYQNPRYPFQVTLLLAACSALIWWHLRATRKLWPWVPLVFIVAPTALIATLYIRQTLTALLSPYVHWLPLQLLSVLVQWGGLFGALAVVQHLLLKRAALPNTWLFTSLRALPCAAFVGWFAARCLHHPGSDTALLVPPAIYTATSWAGVAIVVVSTQLRSLGVSFRDVSLSALAIVVAALVSVSF